MWKRLSVLWTLVKGDARMLWHALQHPQSPSWLKWSTLGLMFYVVSPIDLIPDVIPIIGLMDDIVLVPMAIRWLLKKLPAHVRHDVEQKMGRSA